MSVAAAWAKIRKSVEFHRPDLDPEVAVVAQALDPMTSADAEAVREAWERLREHSYCPAEWEGDAWARYQADLALVQAAQTAMLTDAKLIVDAFAAGLFVRSTKHDDDPTWAMKLVRPLSALARFTVWTEEKTDG